MRKLWLGLALLVALAAGGVALLALSLPGARPQGAPAPVPDAERERLLAALRPPKRARPLVAVLAANEGSETTDFVVPFGVLRASGAADVVAVGMRAEPVVLMPALRIRPEIDAAGFAASHPDGADYVIVPAMHHSDDPAVAAWIAAQARGGATIVGVCEGAWLLRAAGLLDGRAATTHWFSLGRLRKSVPSLSWVADRRYVADRGVVTTTGVSASLPISLELVEAIAGRERAEALAAEFGVSEFGPEHASRAFALDRRALATATANTLFFWRHETLELPIADGVDEIALALTADAWARTYRTQPRARAAAAEVVSKRGLTLLADGSAAGDPELRLELPPPGASAIDAALDGIARRYGATTADFVALQLEYDRPGTRAPR